MLLARSPPYDAGDDITLSHSGYLADVFAQLNPLISPVMSWLLVAAVPVGWLLRMKSPAASNYSADTAHEPATPRFPGPGYFSTNEGPTFFLLSRTRDEFLVISYRSFELLSLFDYGVLID